ATALEASDGIEPARDACQEAFLVAWRKLHALREPEAFGAWLKRLVRTQCARVRRRRATFAERPAGLRVRREIGATASDVAELACDRESDDLIHRAVAGLPAGEQQAVVLFYFLGESLRFVAQALGVSAGTAGKRVYAARLRLRRALPSTVTERFLG